ncbi:fungal-specific transcription factor domain-containing protein, partial [Microdochium trichocladiopsis]
MSPHPEPFHTDGVATLSCAADTVTGPSRNLKLSRAIWQLSLAELNRELERDPSERHAFMFRHNLSAALPKIEDFRPLPSQVPFLINVFHENVNMFMQVAHIPTIHEMARGMRTNGPNSLSSSNEALFFSIYYAAVTSMEDDDVLANFGTTKNELGLKFRLGFEHALAKADFLNSPDLTLVQALTIFLFLVRRYDSPRYVWMLTGVAIRMAKSLGLHRDGTSFANLTPFEIEMRRRVWWALYMLDLRSSEDQGTDITILEGSFDTKRPLHINDDDISPQTKETPRERQGYTDMTIPGVYMETGSMAIKLLFVDAKDGVPDIEYYGRLIVESYATLDKYGSQIGNIRHRMGMIIASLVLSKVTLMLYLPVVAASPHAAGAEAICTKLLTSAIEVAEFHHELNDEKAFRQWRWMFQTYTHWYAIVYMLIQISRRPWSPTSERAWIALHSPWLIPKYPQHVDRNNQVVVPLRRLMARSREHRARELCRLQADPQAMRAIEDDERRIAQPRSAGIDVPSSDVRAYYFDRWRYII